MFKDELTDEYRHRACEIEPGDLLLCLGAMRMVVGVAINMRVSYERIIVSVLIDGKVDSFHYAENWTVTLWKYAHE
jgi:hypothetical protein